VSEHPRKILARLEQRARRRFGQNFLASTSALGRIADVAQAGDGSRIVEIGPGLGALSRVLLERGARVRAMEIDRDLVAFLREEIPDLELLEGDALQADWDALAPGEGWTVCANLPYNVATPLVTRMVTLAPRLNRLVLMFQQEVARRLVAVPRTSAYGSLSVHAQAWAEVKLAFHLPPSAFHPAPRVKSSVVVFQLRETPRLGGSDADFFEKVVRAGFSQRRKTLLNSLSTAFDRGLVRDVLNQTDHMGQRAEELGVEEWGPLALALKEHTNA